MIEQAPHQDQGTARGAHQVDSIHCVRSTDRTTALHCNSLPTHFGHSQLRLSGRLPTRLSISTRWVSLRSVFTGAVDWTLWSGVLSRGSFSRLGLLWRRAWCVLGFAFRGSMRGVCS
ncbi:hypothetical protein KC19_2G127300 [Ceratodon purpureus]|uniref:Uncharacterized protein n=1 Tax=Ceratodon purpureus TaxID=3225 RepID=A0A8T0IW61_CERPU|nr:hypothetical protein KC19_2G127300 [Ceratodon purpureus]